MNAPTNVEVWKNTANGPRHYITFGMQGQELSKVVQGNRTFTLTTFERQINQERAASPEQDLFRDGSFVIVKDSEETNENEIESDNSVTDQELGEMVSEILHDAEFLDGVLTKLTSANSLNRLLEFLVAEDASMSVIERTREAFQEADGSVVPNQRKVVSA